MATMASWIISVYVLLAFDAEEGFFAPFLLALSLPLFGVLLDEDAAGDAASDSIGEVAAAGALASFLGEEESGGDLSSLLVGV